MDRTWIKGGIKQAIISEADIPSLLVQRVARIRTNKNLIPEFLHLLISGRAFEKYVLSIQTGTGVPHISAEQIKKFKILVPKIDEQLEIISKIQAFKKNYERLHAQAHKSVEDLANLETSIMHKAFDGKLS